MTTILVLLLFFLLKKKMFKKKYNLNSLMLNYEFFVYTEIQIVLEE